MSHTWSTETTGKNSSGSQLNSSGPINPTNPSSSSDCPVSTAFHINVQLVSSVTETKTSFLSPSATPWFSTPVSASVVNTSVNMASTLDSELFKTTWTPPLSQSVSTCTWTTNPVGQFTPAWLQTVTGSNPRSRSSFWGVALMRIVNIWPRGGGICFPYSTTSDASTVLSPDWDSTLLFSRTSPW